MTDGRARPLSACHTLSYLFNYAVPGHADRPAGYHATLNQSCGVVRDHLCRATPDIIDIYRWNRREDLVAEAQNRARPWACQSRR